MTYENSFGGTWVWDASDPFNNAAQAQSYTPPLNQNWTWGVNTIYGVNLGGWLVTEPFIVSGLYETYSTGPAGTSVDEYTLSLNMGSNLTEAMTQHYETFITERDIAEIATAGLNWVRIPIGHWAVATIPGEPYLQGVSWTYFLKAVQWCRKYGIRIKLDLHTAPGSQNGWNHSGRLGSINWMNGVMGIANAQRSLDVMRTFAQFITQPQYTPVIPLFGFLNEPNGQQLAQSTIGSFYAEAYRMLREVTGLGAGNGAFLSMHDAFDGVNNWVGFLTGADRLAIDQHPYMVSVYIFSADSRHSKTNRSAPCRQSRPFRAPGGRAPPTPVPTLLASPSLASGLSQSTIAATGSTTLVSARATRATTPATLARISARGRASSGTTGRLGMRLPRRRS